MPVFPTYTADQGLDFGRVPQVDIGAGYVTQAMGKLAGGLDQAADAAYRYQQREKQKTAFDTEASFQKLNAYQENQIAEFERNAPADGKDYHVQALQQYDQTANNWLKALPPDQQKEYGEKLAIMREKAAGQTAAFEYKQRGAYEADTLQQQLDQGLTIIRGDPTQKDAVLANMNKQVDLASSIDPASKEKIKQGIASNIATAKWQTLYANDPIAGMRALGFQPLEPKGSPATSSPADVSTLQSFVVPGKPPETVSGMHPALQTGLAAMFRDAPPDVQKSLQIFSGYRSDERQKQLWDAAVQKYGSEAEARKWVAPPGHSEHNKGNAADLSFDGAGTTSKLSPAGQAAMQWAHDNAAKYGLSFPLSNEPWHVEAAGARGGDTTGSIPNAPAPPVGSDNVFARMIHAESSGNPAALSPKGAMGLTQLMPDTARETAKNLGIDLPADNAALAKYFATPEGQKANLRIGQAYFQQMLQKFGGDTEAAVVAYNGGPGLANKWIVEGRVDSALPKETRDYRNKVLYGHDAPASARPGTIVGGDPEYAAITYDQRVKLADQAQRDYQQQQTQAAADLKLQISGLQNDLQNKLIDGKAGLPDIQQARDAGWLSDADTVEKFRGIVEKRDGDQATVGMFTARMGQPGANFNAFDEKDQKAADATFKAMGGSLKALDTIYGASGIVPKSAATQLRAGIFGSDPAMGQQALEVASNIMQKNPNAFRSVTDGGDISNSAVKYQHYLDQGMSGVDAAKRVLDENSPAFKPKPVTDADLKTFTDGITVSAVGHLFDQHPNIPGFGDPKVGADPVQQGAILADFRDVAVDFYKQTGDPKLAMAQATAQLAKVYGVTNILGQDTLTKYPPEKSYPPVNGSWDYIINQAADEVRKQTGKVAASAPLYMADPKPAGLVSPGNIDLKTRPQVKNDDGSISTVRTISFGRDDGKEVLIPTVSNEGKILSNQEAIKYWNERGQNLGVFNTPDDADAYAEALHNQQDQWYLRGGKDSAAMQASKYIDRADIGLLQAPQTAQQFLAGKPAPYQIVYYDTVNGQKVLQTLNGGPFVADPTAAQSASTLQAEPQFRGKQLQIQEQEDAFTKAQQDADQRARMNTAPTPQGAAAVPVPAARPIVPPPPTQTTPKQDIQKQMQDLRQDSEPEAIPGLYPGN